MILKCKSQSLLLLAQRSIRLDVPHIFTRNISENVWSQKTKCLGLLAKGALVPRQSTLTYEGTVFSVEL